MKGGSMELGIGVVLMSLSMIVLPIIVGTHAGEAAGVAAGFCGFAGFLAGTALVTAIEERE